MGADVSTPVVAGGTAALDASLGRLARLCRCEVLPDVASLPVAPEVPASWADPDDAPPSVPLAELRLFEGEPAPDGLPPPVEPDSWFEVDPACDPGPEERGGLVVAPWEASDELDPVDPGEPLGSANAIGIATTAEPTPNATASAPTRPTYRAGSLCGIGVNPGRRTSMGCTAVTARRWRPPAVEREFLAWVCFPTKASSKDFATYADALSID